MARDLEVVGGAVGGICRCISLPLASMSIDGALYNINKDALDKLSAEIKSL